MSTTATSPVYTAASSRMPLRSLSFLPLLPPPSLHPNTAPARVRSQTKIVGQTSLDSIEEEEPIDREDPNSPNTTARATGRSHQSSTPTRTTAERARYRLQGSHVSSQKRRNGKGSDLAGLAEGDICGICFETAVKPDRTRCCGQLFCHQHLSDWLGARASDGRCPGCRTPLSLGQGTVALHTPIRRNRLPLPACSPQSPHILQPPRAPDSDYDQTITSGTSSSEYSRPTSAGAPVSDMQSTRQRQHLETRTIVVRPEYENMQDLVSALVPFHLFGALLSLLGCGLVVGMLLS